MHQIQRFEPTAGFTLIELLVVIAIAASMAALVVMPMGRWFSGVKARSEVAELHGALQLRIKTALLQAKALEIDASKPAARADVFWPDGWSLKSGRVEVTERGYCKGGELRFEAEAAQALITVSAGQCAINTQRT